MLSVVRAGPLVAVLLVAGCGERPLEPSEPTPGAPHFKIATYNVELNSAAESSTVKAVGATDADVVSLQEITTDWETKLRDTYEAEYPYMLFHADGGAGGLATLSRYPLTDLGLHPGPGGWHPAWHVEVALPGVRLQVLNVHLRSLLSGESGAIQSYLSTDEDHVAQIKDFSADCDTKLMTIVLGDFNESPDGDAVKFLEGLGFRNILPLYHPGQPTWRFPSVAGQLSTTYDHILFDDNLRPLNSWVLNRGASDHLAVVAHLEPYEFDAPSDALADE